MLARAQMQFVDWLDASFTIRSKIHVNGLSPSIGALLCAMPAIHCLAVYGNVRVPDLSPLRQL